jgi:hypothetical protein
MSNSTAQFNIEIAPNLPPPISPQSPPKPKAKVKKNPDSIWHYKEEPKHES